MSYSYAEQRKELFTEHGADMLMRVRDRVKYLLSVAGAFREAQVVVSGDSWTAMAALEYLVERKEIVCVRSECWAQYRVYSTPEVSSR